jgi:hypothetical protein
MGGHVTEIHTKKWSANFCVVHSPLGGGQSVPEMVDGDARGCSLLDITSVRSAGPAEAGAYVAVFDVP